MASASYQVVNIGVDSLWLNVCYGKGDDMETCEPDRHEVMDTALLERLAVYQEVARAAETPIPTDFTFADACLLMYGNSGGLKSPWRFILRNHALELKIGLGKRDGLIAKVRLSAEYLWSENNLLSCLYEVHSFLLGVFNAMVYLQVSRVDPCADVSGYDFGLGEWRDGFIRRCGLRPHFSLDDLSTDDDDMWACVNTEEQDTAEDNDEQESFIVGPDEVHMRYRPITGFSFGSRKSALSAIVYNKSSYISYQKKETDWFVDLWRSHGYEEQQGDVWRVEFHVTREALRDMSIESAYQLPTRLDALWEYCTIQWLRYVVPCADTNRSRWAAHPVWEVLQGAYAPTVTYEQVELGPIVRERKRVINEERLVAQLVGCLSTKHAWYLGKRPCEDDISIALHVFAGDADIYLTERMKDFTQQVRKKQHLYSLVGSLAA